MLLLLSGCQTAPKQQAVTQLRTQVQLEQLLTHAEQAYHRQAYDQAEALFSQVEQLDANNQQALFRLGNLFFRRGDLKKSANYFSRLVAINPKNAKAHYNLGTIHLMFAEKHMQYFTATAPKQFDISKVSELLGVLANFSQSRQVKKPLVTPSHNSLDQLADQLKH